MGQRLGIAAALLGDPGVLILDEPVNGLDPEGVLWIRNLMKQLAAEGRTILASSHLMNEMAVTADYLIVIGRGKLITESSTGDVIARSTNKSVRVRTPDAARLAELISAAGGKVAPAASASADGAGLLTVTGLEASVAEIVSFGSFFVGSAILHAHVAVSLSDQGVTRAVAGAGLYLTVLGLFALAIGTMIRHTAGAIATVIGIVFVLPILSGLLPGSWGAHINAYLPEQAGSVITHTHQQPSDLLSPWQGFGVLCIWTVLLLAAAAYLLERRDA